MYKFINDKMPIIFSDVDGTLYDHSKIPNQQTIEDIKFAKENNAHFNICTGNPYFERMRWLTKLIDVDYLISSSGAHIIDIKNDKTIYSKSIQKLIFNKILTIAKSEGIQLCFWDENNYFLLNNDSLWNDEILEYHFTNEATKKMFPQIYNNEDIHPLKVEIYSKAYNDEKKVKKELNNLFDLFKDIDGINITLTSINIEIQAKNVNKGEAILWLLKNVYNNININQNDIMVIGDSNNDYSMIILSKYSYAMANASNLILTSASYFTSSVEQNGLGEAIIDYLYRFKNVVKKYLLH